MMSGSCDQATATARDRGHWVAPKERKHGRRIEEIMAAGWPLLGALADRL